jgi:DNA-binding NtrC family response regulator
MARGLEACSTLSKDLAVALLQVRPFDLLIVDPSEPGTSELLMRSQNLPRRPQIILLVDDASVPPPITPDQPDVLGVIEKPLLLDSLRHLLDRISHQRCGPAA